MKLFYTRCSTVQQNADRVIENFKKIDGFSSQVYFFDKVQGNVPFFQREGASKLFDKATTIDRGVQIYVDSVDRFGRDTIDILTSISLFSKNGISVTFLKEGFTTLDEHGKESEYAKLILGIMSSIAQMERNRIKERTQEGIAIAKSKGKFTGRKLGSIQTDEKLLERHSLVVKKLQRGVVMRDINAITGISLPTIVKVKKVLVKRRLI
jgi:DNA invertase Pin-like site-specific DNA recombinase